MHPALRAGLGRRHGQAAGLRERGRRHVARASQVLSRRSVPSVGGGRKMRESACTIRRAVPVDAEPLADLAARTFRVTFEAYTSPQDMATHLVGSYSPALQLAEITSPEIT